MAHVASALRAGASLDRQRRAHLATLLSLCRLHLAVSSSSSSDEKDFLDWSSSDTDYDAEIVMSAALSVRAVSLALHVAHERDCVEKCVEAILASPALLPLTRSELMLIQKNGAMELRLLESVLEPQVHLSIAALSQRMVVPVIRATLPQMSVRELQFAEALLASAAKSSLETEHAEVYMSVVLALVKKLGAESAVDAGEGAKMLLEARKMHQASALDRKGLQQQQQQQQQIALRANDSFEGGEFASEQRVSSIASGWNHSACVLDGSLYSWGKCDHGALGVGQSFTVEDMRASKSYAAPQLVLFGSSVQIHSVACGGEHTLALDVDGSVWAFGLNDHGQLGTGDRLSCESPRPLSLTFRIKSVACGHSHSGLLDAKGRVWASGLDDDGQVSGTTVGRDVLSPLELSATLVATKKPMMAGVACGFAHTAVWSVDGEVFTVGNNVYGQLGRADGPSTRVTETVGTKRIHFASCGSFHTLAVTDLGSVYEWGGKGKQKPRLVEGLVGRRILEVCGGHSFDSICRTAQGEVWRWRQDQEVEAVKVEGCRAIAAGEDFFVVACTGGSVWSWGSGSYGQLGLGEVGVATAVPRRLAFPVAKPANPVLTSAAVEQDHLAPQHQTQPVLYVRKLYDLLLQLPANRLSNTLVELSSCDGRVASAVHLRQNRCLAAFLHAASAREGEAGLLTAMEDWVVQSKPTFDPLYQDCRRFLSAPFSMAARSSMMWAALWQWRRRGFNSQVLADWLQGKLVQSPDLAHIVQQLLLSPFSPPPPPECPLVVDVPIPVLLSIATSPSIHHVHEEDTARLWESVRSNLSKALDQDFIALNKVPASDSVVFSCGHTVSQESFRTQLASLRRALEDAPAWKGAAASIIDKEYALPGAIHMSCPRCVQSTM
jgi:alpha-tubulin suppressor-like RCC1 family protein